MNKVELEAKVNALNDEINFFRTFYETVRTSGVQDMSHPTRPNQGPSGPLPTSGPVWVCTECVGVLYPALYPFWTQESMMSREFKRS